MNSSNASNLSSPTYGYNFVVSITQASINATMKIFLSTRTEPVFSACYVADANGHPLQIDYTKLKALANGSDPFTIPANADPITNPDLQSLINARFIGGFRASVGLPAEADPSKLPDIVTLGSQASSVGFNLLCSEFMIVEFKPASASAPPKWTSISQTADAPWVFTSKLDLRQSTVDQSAYSTLPQAIKDKIGNLGSAAFSIQQLLFDFTNASLMTFPVIQGIQPGDPSYLILQTYFHEAYFAAMRKDGDPLLGCSIVMNDAAPSTLTLTDFNFEVNPYVDPSGNPFPNPTPPQQQLSTLNYLCAADHSPLPPLVPFTWNWVDASEVNDHDGIIAINRNTLGDYFRDQLMPYVRRNCLRTDAHADSEGFEASYSVDIRYDNSPTVTVPNGSTVLRFDYESKSNDEAGLDGDLGKITFNSNYTLTVDFSGNTIVVTQHQVIYLCISSAGWSIEGNCVDKMLVDRYTIGVNQDGQLVAPLSSDPPVDNSKVNRVGEFANYFNNLDDILDSVPQALSAFVSTSLSDIPISTIENFVFPGGKTFLYKHVGFSNNQDLVSFISYADPTTIAVVPPSN